MCEEIKEKKFEILNYDELPRKYGKGAYKNKLIVDWGGLNEGFIFKTQSEKYGYNEIEFLKYDDDKHRIYIKYKDSESDLSIYNLLKGGIGGILIEEKPYEVETFKILNNIPQTPIYVLWDRICSGTVLKTQHIKYGYNEFTFIKYENKFVYLIYEGSSKKIDVTNFLNGNIGRIIGEITNNFKYNIGDVINTKERNLTIIDRILKENPYNKGKFLKYYKYKCNICGFDCKEHYVDGKFSSEYSIEESNMKSGENGCACCSNRVAVLGINTIYDTDPWMMSLGVSEEDAKRYTRGNHKKIEVVCPDCGKKKDMIMYNLIKYKSIGCSCSDKISYPEKFMINTLNQLNIEFQTQLNKSVFNWCKKYKYDFYIPSLNMIIETHGMQHYEKNGRKGARTLEEEQKNDRVKKEMALINGIEHYIVIDCRYSDLEWIKKSIFNSKLAEIFDLSKIDWSKCEEFALSSLVKMASKIRRNSNNILSCGEISDIMGLHRATISRYLKRASSLGWCDYSPEIEMKRSGSKIAGHNKKQVEMFKDGQSLGIFESGHELSRQSENLFCVKLDRSAISQVCLGKKPQYKGFTFKYI